MPIPSRVNKRQVGKPVNISLIKPVQDHLDIYRLDAVRKWMKLDTSVSIYAVPHNGYYYIWNGHHRAYVAQEIGKTEIGIIEVEDGRGWLNKKTDSCDEIRKMKVVSSKEFKLLHKRFKEAK